MKPYRTAAEPADVSHDVAPHLAYTVVTGLALHRMLDPRPSIAS